MILAAYTHARFPRSRMRGEEGRADLETFVCYRS
jgi:hypothetical protein